MQTREIEKGGEREGAHAHKHTKKEWYGKALSKSVRIKCKYSATFSFENSEWRTTATRKKTNFKLKSTIRRVRENEFTYICCEFSMGKNMDSFCTKIYTRDCNLDESSCWIRYTLYHIGGVW